MVQGGEYVIKKNLYRIIIFLVVIFAIGTGKSYGVSVNKEIGKWYAGEYTNSGKNTIGNEEDKEKILSKINDIGYDGNSINNEMKLETKITVVKKKKTNSWSSLFGEEPKYEYEIRIRKQNKRWRNNIQNK